MLFVSFAIASRFHFVYLQLAFNLCTKTHIRAFVENYSLSRRQTQKKQCSSVL